MINSEMADTEVCSFTASHDDLVIELDVYDLSSLSVRRHRACSRVSTKGRLPGQPETPVGTLLSEIPQGTFLRDAGVALHCIPVLLFGKCYTPTALSARHGTMRTSSTHTVPYIVCLCLPILICAPPQLFAPLLLSLLPQCWFYGVAITRGLYLLHFIGVPKDQMENSKVSVQVEWTNVHNNPNNDNNNKNNQNKNNNNKCSKGTQTAFDDEEQSMELTTEVHSGPCVAALT